MAVLQLAHQAAQCTVGPVQRELAGYRFALLLERLRKLGIVMTRKNHPRGTENVLTDLGFGNAEELSAKAILAVKLNELIDKRGLSQVEAARITGMTQPKVSQVRRYKLQNISLERLMQALVSLDQHVEIVVRPARRADSAGITVAA